MTSSLPNESVLIQPVESPVIRSPYYEPTNYWDYDRAKGRANKRDGRRPAAYWYKFAEIDTRRGQLSLELEEDRRELALVNKLRADVKRWRNAGWEGATNVTKDFSGTGRGETVQGAFSFASWKRRRRYFFSMTSQTTGATGREENRRLLSGTADRPRFLLREKRPALPADSLRV